MTQPDLSHIAEGLRHLAVPLETLNIDPANARVHGERNLAAIRASLAKFGQYQPLVVQRQGMIVRVGNGRVAAMRAMGWTQAAALVVDESDVEAVLRAIADNRTAELAEWDYSELQHILGTLPAYDLANVGWNADEIGAIGGIIDMDLPSELDTTHSMGDTRYIIVPVPSGTDRETWKVEIALRVPEVAVRGSWE